MKFGGGPPWGEYRSGGTGGSHPEIKIAHLAPGVRPISQSQVTKGARRGSPLSWGEYRSGGTEGSHLGMDIFLDRSPLG